MNERNDRILESLDEAQREAATSTEGPVRIIAGAGAGKTRTITRRIAYACACGDWDPSRVLAVTFSVKAAEEMRSRIGQLGVDGVTAATFHSAALHQLNRVWADVTDAPFPDLQSDHRPLIAAAYARVTGAGEPEPLTVRDLEAEINWTKVSLVSPDDYVRVCAATHRQPPAELDPARMADLIGAYEADKTARNQIDFNDILLMVCHLLEDPELKEASAQIRGRIGWLTVDEYQDVSPLQHRLMRLWLGNADGGRGNRNVCVVGDAAQTIYSFAGATSYYLRAFGDEFGPLSADVTLNIDYRSTASVVRYANRVLAASPERTGYIRLASGQRGSDGPRVTAIRYESDADEARGVAQRFVRMIAKGAKPSDCAVLTRINAQQGMIAAALKEAGLGYRVRTDNGWQAQSLSVETLKEDLTAGVVTISTIHAAKGLEFPHVCIVGCSEGLLPFGSPAPGDALEEERRLMYVGVTRAERTLQLSFAVSKDGYAATRRAPSRFLQR
ncbi:ATP-dependent helicase [Bifidobacterium vespertilionis]|uniref:DNA 3'-5' helicase n=1 Tax=Bifidobacterium vespertilionis TaxID=2562524 RepID=A0A5J5DTS7_9BIFI|nr:ATP-dependent helicase [Bifidobacterium vespertilionis]KAA8818874.1 ATP-dependent helicase [Bifidobacterium vespertilionis]KAA8823006.1 ATP-dependent helicase [Bifidobacterium vespertilionis]